MASQLPSRVIAAPVRGRQISDGAVAQLDLAMHASRQIACGAPPRAAPTRRAHPELHYLKGRYAAEVADAFRTVLASLDAKARNMLNHYYIDQLTTDMIAKLYRVDGSTIRRQLSRLPEQILQETHRLVADRLRVTGSDASRLLALVRSELRSSVVSVLKS